MIGGWWGSYWMPPSTYKRHSMNLITRDEILDLYDWLQTVTHLKDLGITGVDCKVVIYRHSAEGTHQVFCLLTGGHNGDHDTGNERT